MNPSRARMAPRIGDSVVDQHERYFRYTQGLRDLAHQVGWEHPALLQPADRRCAGRHDHCSPLWPVGAWMWSFLRRQMA